MRRGRTFILLGILLALLAVLLYVFLSRPTQPSSKTAQPTVPAVPMTKVVVAVQNIARGTQIVTDHVKLLDWPQAQVPPTTLLDPAKAVGKYAGQDIPQGMPILPALLAESAAAARATGGSQAAIAIVSGKVGVAFPLRSTYPENQALPFDRRDKEVLPRLLSVAYAVQPGDRVDVISCFWIYEIDKEFQTRKPNRIGIIDPEKPGSPVEGIPGRPAVAPGGLAAIEGPAEAQLPRMVCQWMVQNARVIGLGDWGQPLAAPTPTGPQQGGGGPPTPTPLPPLPQVLTLEVDPQDALVLKYARETGAQLDMVLRAAGDKESRFTTDAVSLQYIFEKFRITIPTKLDFTIAGGGGVAPIGARQP